MYTGGSLTTFKLLLKTY